MKFRHPSFAIACVALAGSLSSLAAGCGADEPDGPPAEVAGAPEAVAEERQALSTCITIARHSGGEVHDAQLARRVGTAIATDPDANANFGALPTARVGNISVSPKRSYKSLLAFVLPGTIPANATVTSAVVTLDTTNTGASTIRVKRSTAPWDEGAVTFRSWNNAQSSEDYASFSAGPGAGGVRTFDITALAQAWLDGVFANHGMVLLGETSTLTFATSETANAAVEPKLELCYTTPDPCSPSPCLNNGTCTTTPDGSYDCICYGGFTGQSCDVPPSACPCATAGVPWLAGHIADAMSYCSYDETRAVAFTSLDISRSYGAGINPANGEGYCFSTAEHFDCATMGLVITPEQAAVCRAQILEWGFNGQLCSQDEYIPGSCEPCFPNPCQHGGSCTNDWQSYSYTCACPAGYFGPSCEFQGVDPCVSNPCQNGGACVAENGGTYTCACAPGYTGQHCETVEACPCHGSSGWQSGSQVDPILCGYNELGAYAYTGPGFGDSFGTGYDFFESAYYCGFMEMLTGSCIMLTISEQQASSCRQEVLDWGAAQCAESEFNYGLSCPFF
jgi:hypothetical protein